MARQTNDGRGRLGGRAKGTPNRTTKELREFVISLIETAKPKLTKDLADVEPYQRLQIVEKLLQYVLPKQQSISLEAQIEAEYNALMQLLDDAPDEAIDQITDKIRNLKNNE